MTRITYFTAALSLLSLMTLEADAARGSRHNICRPSRHRSKPQKSSQGPVQAPERGSNVTAAGIAAANNNNGNGKKKQLFRIADYWSGKNFFDGWDFWDQAYVVTLASVWLERVLNVISAVIPPTALSISLAHQMRSRRISLILTGTVLLS